MSILHSGSRVIRHRSFWNWFLFLKGENVCLFSQLSWKLCNFFIPTNLLSACCTSQETQETRCWEFQVVHRWRWSSTLVLEQFLSPCTWYYSMPIKKQLKIPFPGSGAQIRRVKSFLSKVCFPGGGDLFQATLDFLIYSSCPWSPRWPRIIIWMHAMHIFITSADNRTIDRSSPDGRPIEQGCISKRNFPPPYCGTAITAMIAETTESISLLSKKKPSSSEVHWSLLIVTSTNVSDCPHGVPRKTRRSSAKMNIASSRSTLQRRIEPPLPGSSGILARHHWSSFWGTIEWTGKSVVFCDWASSEHNNSGNPGNGNCTNINNNYYRQQPIRRTIKEAKLAKVCKILGPGRPSAGRPRRDRRSVTQKTKKSLVIQKSLLARGTKQPWKVKQENEKISSDPKISSHKGNQTTMESV